MTCGDPQQLSAFVNGTLQAAKRDDFSSHLDSCSECTSVVAALMLEARQEARTEAPPLRDLSAARYELGRELYRGGMGRILSAYDRMLGRTVAMKCLRDDRSDTRRFAHEIAVMSKLQHPSVMPLYDQGSPSAWLVQLSAH
jgi:serine/threonine protein kinase